MSWLLGSLGYPIPKDEVIISHVGHGVRQFVKSCLPKSTGEDEARLESALELFKTRYGANLAEETVPYPGIREVLEALSKRGEAAWVLTNKPGYMARDICSALGLGDFLGGVLGAGDVPANKPDPSGLLEVCSRLDVFPSSVWYVGDMAVDVETSRRAGCKSALVTWGYGGEGLLREGSADRVLRRPEDLLSLGSS